MACREKGRTRYATDLLIQLRRMQDAGFSSVPNAGQNTCVIYGRCRLWFSEKEDKLTNWIPLRPFDIMWKAGLSAEQFKHIWCSYNLACVYDWTFVPVPAVINKQSTALVINRPIGNESHHMDVHWILDLLVRALRSACTVWCGHWRLWSTHHHPYIECCWLGLPGWALQAWVTDRCHQGVWREVWCAEGQAGSGTRI